MPQSLIEKIAQHHAAPESVPAERPVRAGDFITIRPKHVMTHDNTSAVMGKFKSIGATRIHDPKQPVFAIDHDIQNTSPENLGKYAKIEQFAREQGVDFYPAGTGISHQVMVEYGYVTPGSMVVGSDSHSNLYGAGCCLGTPVVRTDGACIWATGQTWWQVPPVARVNLTGRLLPGVVGKDVIIALCGLYNNDEVLNHVVEFAGDGIASLTMDQRMTIANMTTEWGVLAGVFPFDEVLREYLYGRADFLEKRGTPRYTRADVEAWWAKRDELAADDDAQYAVELTLDLSTVIPHVSGPDHVKVMEALPKIERERVAINKAYLVSCVNARLEDLREAADIVQGRTVADGVEFYVAPASANVQKQAEEDGTWQTLLDAGAIPLPSGCGPCIGLGAGTLEPGEVAISATNRNFKGRMGSRDAKAYLGSPAVVAASAVAGYICAPQAYEHVEARFELHRPEKRNGQSGTQGQDGSAEILEGFPDLITGRALWLAVDNLNTDGIYSGELTYRDDVTDEEMAAACFANYDPQFSRIGQPGDIVVSGRNFGTGSSREQAATALQKRGIQCVLAYSFSETYKRNAFNNGFMAIECPGLVEHFEATYGGPQGTKSADSATTVGPVIELDFAASVVRCSGQAFAFTPLSTVAQELIVAGGAEAQVRQRLAGVS